MTEFVANNDTVFFKSWLSRAGQKIESHLSSGQVNLIDLELRTAMYKRYINSIIIIIIMWF